VPPLLAAVLLAVMRAEKPPRSSSAMEELGRGKDCSAPPALARLLAVTSSWRLADLQGTGSVVSGFEWFTGSMVLGFEWFTSACCLHLVPLRVCAD
jgi:hypothetical protein